MIGTYNYWLVALSVLVAIFASYTALDLARRSIATHGSATWAWLVGGAFSMGIGIWSMHFIGMLAFSSPVAMSSDVAVILLSLLIAVLVSGFALYTVSREQLSWGSLLIGGVLMGFGICAMQYTGMAAMELSPPIRDEPWLFAAAVMIAIVASHVALFIAFTLRGVSKTAPMPAILKRPRMRDLLIRGILDLAHQYYELVAAEARDRVFAPTRHAETQKLAVEDMTERFGHLRSVHNSTRTLRPAKKLTAALAAD